VSKLPDVRAVEPEVLLLPLRAFQPWAATYISVGVTRLVASCKVVDCDASERIGRRPSEYYGWRGGVRETQHGAVVLSIFSVCRDDRAKEYDYVELDGTHLATMAT
jgi:hypothetical protein